MPAPVKILFVLPALVAGGAERVMIELMNGLDRSRFMPSFLCVSDNGSLRPLIAPDVPFACLHTSVTRSLPGLYRHIRKLRPDIVISTMAHMNFAVLMLQPFLQRTKFIVRESITPSFILEKHKAKAPLLRAAWRVLYKRADLVVSPAQIVIDEFSSLLKMDTSRHVCLPNPVDVAAIRSEEALPPGPPPSRRKGENGEIQFVAAGRLHPQKGFDRLIEILPRLPQQIQWHLTILGEGEEREKLTALLQRLNLSDRVSMPGLIERPWPFYGASDAFLLPSRFEGLPNVALEALACGTKVIAMREAGGIGEIAALASDSVTLCSDMEQFVKTMAAVTASATAGHRPSLLPDCYRREAVEKRFSELLDKVSGRQHRL